MEKLKRNLSVILIYSLISFILIGDVFSNRIGMSILFGLGFSMLNEIILHLRKLNEENINNDKKKDEPKQLND
jgi:hypothetical protein